MTKTLTGLCELNACDPFQVVEEDKDHPGRYGMWRLPAYRGPETLETAGWCGKTPKSVCITKVIHRWIPPGISDERLETICHCLVPSFKLPCCVNSYGAVQAYLSDGSPPVTLPSGSFDVASYWES
jgi:hypothetical protein